MRTVIVGPVILIAATAAFLVFSAFGHGPTSTEAGPACDQSYGAFSFLDGHWEGTWNNTTYSTSGDVTADVTIDSDCTATAVIEKEQGNPWTVNATFADEAGGSVITIVGDPVFGDTTIHVRTDGVITISGDNLPQYGIKHAEGSGQFDVQFHSFISMDLFLVFQDDSTADETLFLVANDVPTETPPTTTVTPVPSATPGPQEVVWGNSDCSEAISARDNQALFRFVLQQIPLSQTQPCPALNHSVYVVPDVGPQTPAVGLFWPWGDWDCNNDLTARDNQALLRYILDQQPLSQGEGCPAIGESVAIED